MSEGTKGNAVVLVIKDSSAGFWEHELTKETIFNALDHFCLPYRILDLAVKRPDSIDFKECAGIIISQGQLGRRLTSFEKSHIVDAVKSGCGLVNFDNDIRYWDELNHIFGFDDINPFPYATNIIRITENNHYITRMQNEGEYHKLNRMTTAIDVGKYNRNVKILAEGILGRDQLIYIRHFAPGSAFEPANHPLVFAGEYGSGRAVQFLANPRLWDNEFYGHARGLDDVFLRSIIWTVRKPFAANIIPPYITMTFDDCRGRYDFKYIELCNKYDFIPMPSLFIDDVDESLYPIIRTGQKLKYAEFNTHAFSYYDLLYFEHGRGECLEDKIKSNFEREDMFWSKTGVQPVSTVKAHFGEIGVNSLKYLKQRGRNLINLGRQQLGVMKADMSEKEGFPPYNARNCHIYFLPDDEEIFNFAAQRRDFLTGATANLRESDKNDITKAVRNACTDAMHGLRASFFGEIMTHEQKFEVLSLYEWEEILKGIRTTLKEQQLIFAGHDEIGIYLRNRYQTYFTHSLTDGEDIDFSLNKNPAGKLIISVFKELDGKVVKEFVNY